jgi:hypothetical protein
MVAKLLTNIDMVYYSFIENEAKANNITKRRVVEWAIAYYMMTKKKKEIQNAYEKMGQDTEYLNEMVDNVQYLAHL